jgi:hypothetical protein
MAKHNEEVDFIMKAEACADRRSDNNVVAMATVLVMN